MNYTCTSLSDELPEISATGNSLAFSNVLTLPHLDRMYEVTDVVMPPSYKPDTFKLYNNVTKQLVAEFTQKELDDALLCAQAYPEDFSYDIIQMLAEDIASKVDISLDTYDEMGEPDSLTLVLPSSLPENCCASAMFNDVTEIEFPLDFASSPQLSFDFAATPALKRLFLPPTVQTVDAGTLSALTDILTIVASPECIAQINSADVLPESDEVQLVKLLGGRQSQSEALQSYANPAVQLLGATSIAPDGVEVDIGDRDPDMTDVVIGMHRKPHLERQAVIDRVAEGYAVADLIETRDVSVILSAWSEIMRTHMDSLFKDEDFRIPTNGFRQYDKTISDEVSKKLGILETNKKIPASVRAEIEANKPTQSAIAQREIDKLIAAKNGFEHPKDTCITTTVTGHAYIVTDLNDGKAIVNNRELDGAIKSGTYRKRFRDVIGELNLVATYQKGTKLRFEQFQSSSAARSAAITFNKTRTADDDRLKLPFFISYRAKVHTAIVLKVDSADDVSVTGTITHRIAYTLKDEWCEVKTYKAKDYQEDDYHYLDKHYYTRDFMNERTEHQPIVNVKYPTLLYKSLTEPHLKKAVMEMFGIPIPKANAPIITKNYAEKRLKTALGGDYLEVKYSTGKHVVDEYQVSRLSEAKALLKPCSKCMNYRNDEWERQTTRVVHDCYKEYGD